MIDRWKISKYIKLDLETLHRWLSPNDSMMGLIRYGCGRASEIYYEKPRMVSLFSAKVMGGYLTYARSRIVLSLDGNCSSKVKGARPILKSDDMTKSKVRLTRFDLLQ